MLPSFLCVFIDSSDFFDVSNVFSPKHLTKQEMEIVLNEFKEYKKDLLENETNENSEEVFNTKDKINLINSVIKDYDKLKLEIKKSEDLLKQINSFNSTTENYLSKNK